MPLGSLGRQRHPSAQSKAVGPSNNAGLLKSSTNVAQMNASLFIEHNFSAYQGEFKNVQSIISYPQRGHYGNSKYRGNCTGQLIKDMLRQYQPIVFVDPTLGGGTSADVAEELQREGVNLEFIGLDLHSGFNLLKDSLTTRIGGCRADYCFFHPPYHRLIQYSGKMWGTTPHPDDLSNCDNYEDFLTKMKLAMQNIYESVAPRGHYSILIGDIRKNGVYTSIQADLLQLAPGLLDGIIIKQQFNCLSERKTYTNQNFVPIGHEYLLNFRKDLTVFGMIDTTLNVSRKLQMLSNANWKAVVQSAVSILGGKAKLAEIYEVIEKTSPEKTALRPNWQARVRATLQSFFTPVERGVWAMRVKHRKTENG